MRSNERDAGGCRVGVERAALGCIRSWTMIDLINHSCAAQMSIFKLLLTASMLLLCIAAPADMPPQTSSQGWDAASYGHRRQAKIVTLPASGKSTEFPRLSQSEVDRLFVDSLLKRIDDAVALDKSRIFIVSINKSIAIEKYAAYWLKNSTPLGYSMSKSLTSLAIGKMLCKFPNVTPETKGADVIPEFRNTSWGNATIAQILNMTSGSSPSTPPYTGWQTEKVAAKHRGLYEGRNDLDVVKEMIADDLQSFQPGSSFQYNNYDTLFLGLLVEAVANKPFHQFFDEEIWQKIPSKNDAAWLVNNKGTTYTAMGFSASPEDWIRIGHYVLDSMNRDDCFGKYLKESTNIQLKTPDPFCYGNQFWNFCRPGGAFLFVGFGGQFLIMVPNRSTVIYVHSAIQPNERGKFKNVFQAYVDVIQAIPWASFN